MKFSEGRGEAIQISGEVIEGDAVIRVRDSGIGVPPGWEHQIFQQGVRAPNASSISGPGAGLGLWVTRRIVEAHGGEVLLTSRSEPTEFTIYLPLRG